MGGFSTASISIRLDVESIEIVFPIGSSVFPDASL